MLAKTALKSIFRRKSKSTVVLLVSLAMALFIAMYANAIAEHLQTLDNLYVNIEVTAAFTDSYCKRKNDLNLQEKYILALEDSGFIRQEFYTRYMAYQFEPWDEEEAEQQTHVRNSRLVGANHIQAISSFSHAAMEMPQYLEGYDEALFAQEEPVCIVSSKLGLNLGDEITMTVVEHPSNHSQGPRHGIVTLTVVGVYPSQFADTIYCPWAVMDGIYTELGLPKTWDSANYLLKNTENLSELKSMLRTLHINSPGLSEDQVENLQPGFIINDNLLNNAVSSVKSYVAFMSALYPVIYLLCASIGFVISYLLVRLRKPELAIMRSVGTSRSRAFAFLFLEQSLLCLLGTALGMGITLALAGTLALGQVLSILGYILCYWLGTALAILMINRDNVVGILMEKE